MHRNSEVLFWCVVSILHPAWDKLRDREVACGFSSLVLLKKTDFSSVSHLNRIAIAKLQKIKHQHEIHTECIFFSLLQVNYLNVVSWWPPTKNNHAQKKNILCLQNCQCDRLFNQWPKTCSCEINPVADEQQQAAKAHRLHHVKMRSKRH